MPNGYPQSPAQTELPEQDKRPSTTTNGNEEESYRFGDVSFREEPPIQEDTPNTNGEPYVEDVDATPYPILGQIKFQKTIYSKKAFRKKIDTSIGELISKVEEVDIEKFFKDYYKIFFDIPQNGINSHTTIINESRDFVSNYADYKDEQISDLEKQVETLELQIIELQQGSFDYETGEPTGDGIGDLLSAGEAADRREVLIGDINNPYIYWEPSDEYEDLGLGVGLKNLRKYIGPANNGAANYGNTYLDGKKVEDWTNNNIGRYNAYKSLEDAYNKQSNNSNRRTYNQWISDCGQESTGNRLDLLKALLTYVKNYQMDKLQAANNVG